MQGLSHPVRGAGLRLHDHKLGCNLTILLLRERLELFRLAVDAIVCYNTRHRLMSSISPADYLLFSPLVGGTPNRSGMGQINRQPPFFP